MPAKSSPVPQRRTGTRGSTLSTKRSQRRVRSVIGVSIQPGMIALARTPCRASSTESAFIIEMSAALGCGVVLAARLARRSRPGWPSRPASRRPGDRPCARRGAQACRKAPSRLTDRTRRHSAVVISMNDCTSRAHRPGIREARVHSPERRQGLRERSLDRRLVAHVADERLPDRRGWRAARPPPVLRRVGSPDHTEAPAAASPSAMPSPIPLLPPGDERHLATEIERAKGHIRRTLHCAAPGSNPLTGLARARSGQRALGVLDDLANLRQRQDRLPAPPEG